MKRRELLGAGVRSLAGLALATHPWVSGCGDGGDAPRSRVIVDTDAGIDDMLALSFLLTQTRVDLEAITVVNGLAHVDDGARNVLRLLQVVDRLDIPVYLGATHPLPGGTDFPAAWRSTADTLPGIPLPATTALPRPDAIDFLAERFVSSADPFALLAIGPHTNLTSALAKTEGSFAGVSRMVMMGGAVFVPGNVDRDGNTTAEWNMFADPEAASRVFSAGIPIAMVPLDAAGQVPIRPEFLEAAGRLASPLAEIVSHLLRLGFQTNDRNYFAWDPLAAVRLVDPAVVTSTLLGIDVLTVPPQAGRTLDDASISRHVEVATGASAEAFQATFLGSF